MYYPDYGDFDSIPLRLDDLKAVEPEAWLTDTIMEFYMLFLGRGGDDGLPKTFKEKLKQFHFLSPFIYRKLRSCNTNGVGSASKVSGLVDCS